MRNYIAKYVGALSTYLKLLYYIPDPSGKDFDLMSRRILVASSQDLANEWISHVDFKTCEYKRKCPDIVNACS